VPKKKEKDLYAAILARLRGIRAPFTKSVKEKATKKQIGIMEFVS
jgi:hypothetical protein